MDQRTYRLNSRFDILLLAEAAEDNTSILNSLCSYTVIFWQYILLHISRSRKCHYHWIKIRNSQFCFCCYLELLPLSWWTWGSTFLKSTTCWSLPEA